MTYIDIETVSAFKSYFDADDRTKKLFKSKMAGELERLGVKPGEYGLEEIHLLKLYEQKAALFAEFNKIVCVSLGTELPPPSQASFYVKSFSGHNEKQILIDLAAAFEKGSIYSLAAHFGKGFDYPVLARKYVIHGLPIPHLLNTSGMKPWEIPLHDTAEMWKFGDLRHSCSLDLLAHCFGLPSPKEEMDGSQVGRVYWNEGEDGLKKIVKYCEMDVKTLANAYKRITGSHDTIW
jgi:hypothetical protein